MCVDLNGIKPNILTNEMLEFIGEISPKPLKRVISGFLPKVYGRIPLRIIITIESLLFVTNTKKGVFAKQTSVPA